MNDILSTLVTTLINNFAPVVISALTGWVAIKYNSYLKIKQDELKVKIENDVLNNAIYITLEKLKLNNETLNFINEKALEAIHLAEEKAFQAWKDNNKNEMTSDEKKNVAISFVEQAVGNVVKDKAVLDLIPAIVEQTVSTNRNHLDDLFTSLKKNYVAVNGVVPTNSRDPFSVSSPNVSPFIQ